MGLFCVNEVPENNEIRKIKYENIQNLYNLNL